MAKHEDRPIPVYSELEPVYGDGSQLEEARLRFDRLKAKFVEGLGHPPGAFARSPVISACPVGRMNLVGEHTDCEGYSVLPMAIRQDTMVFIRKHDSGEAKPLLRIGNVHGKYTMCGYPADPEQELDLKNHRWGPLLHLPVRLEVLSASFPTSFCDFAGIVAPVQLVNS